MLRVPIATRLSLTVQRRYSASSMISCSPRACLRHSLRDERNAARRAAAHVHRSPWVVSDVPTTRRSSSTGSEADARTGARTDGPSEGASSDPGSSIADALPVGTAEVEVATIRLRALEG